ncbi:hypothetical protein [Paenibacillus flagellatus]|uniref:hypothetical protein n=1 Tax=Paenibacillus flagellatus TaxID=2211139 RepID=UPI00130534BB|nr:hypothetical protein [Paenibacillus flagellatus]
MNIMGNRVLLTPVGAEDLDWICRTECDAQLWRFEDRVESDEEAVRSLSGEH